MPAFARLSLLAACWFAAEAAPAMAGGGVYLPPAPTGPGGEDRIETSSGSRCSQSINSSGAYVDLGVTGSSATGSNSSGYAAPLVGPDAGRSSEALGYARVTIPLGRRPQRLDCSRLYELEIARMKREIELLKMAAE